MLIQKTPYHSWKTGSLIKGCRECVQGKKMVLFITGLCDRHCFYCPVADTKNQKDVLFANEWDTGFDGRLTKRVKDIIIKEAELTEASGAGITGGDPLKVTNRVCSIIRLLKKRFGKQFHIHLYTPLQYVTKSTLKKLHLAGLDEIRFHPFVWGDKELYKIGWANKFSWKVGVEIPAIPGYEEKMKALMRNLKGKITFMNLNELEISDTNAQGLVKRHYVTKDNISYGVKGSEELAKRLLKFSVDKKLHYSVHYCTCKLKDAVQMAQRLKRRAKNAAMPFDEITDEGMLIRGVIYPEETKPDFGYRKKLKAIPTAKKKALLKKLTPLTKQFSNAFLDEEKIRLIVPLDELKQKSASLKKQGFTTAKVEEYPTYDGFEVEIEFL
ncbi:MAG: radical SAM protein [Nanoarchaeota archaeon]